ncbi:unnamed protein product [Protopolystoma xenopodis]|uniref:Uncharacterized protein n=1 Tax=Protopolystoma xenopodis TaxID=117903 RepID=A0A448XAP7_9PLAT|nr:unnamed protein product [Protopolystoma xenopodis]
MPAQAHLHSAPLSSSRRCNSHSTHGLGTFRRIGCFSWPRCLGHAALSQHDANKQPSQDIHKHTDKHMHSPIARGGLTMSAGWIGLRDRMNNSGEQ